MLSLSILACISPEAVIPGLNYISFGNVGVSGLIPNGVDLSMEANAIALKYLSESQLSQLSLSCSSQRNAMDSPLQTFLHATTDKSLVGFGVISPTNMSFATKKYMKRYGLLQSSGDDGDGEEEQQQPDNYGQPDSIKPDVQLDLIPAFWKSPSKRDGERQWPVHPVQCGIELSSSEQANSEDLVLRKVTQAVIPLRIQEQSNENAGPFLKDLKPKNKLLPGKVEFTQHPGKENLEVQIVPETLGAPALDPLNQADNMNSVGTFLDVQQLRQLPKLF